MKYYTRILGHSISIICTDDSGVGSGSEKLYTFGYLGIYTLYKYVINCYIK